MTAQPLRYAALSKHMSLVLCCVVYSIAAACACAAGLAWDGGHPLAVAALADIVATVTVFLFSVILDNSSIYDPYWSVAPAGIVVYFLCQSPSFPSVRHLLLLLLVAGWAARLTWNWLLRWRGLGDEDWRYADFRSSPVYWLVSFAGFHMFPTVAVFAGCLPLVPALLSPSHSPGVWDAIALAVTAGGIVIEMKADRDLRIFRRRQPPTRELLTSGIWSWCRHPNYLGEVTFWWGIALFGISANPSWWWTAAGAVMITALFLFISAPMMDKHMSSRYPGYRERMKRVPGILPLGLFRGTGIKPH
ncbi:MAG: DUF1295 domain-containing protein [Terracidiphilus sp.]